MRIALVVKYVAQQNIADSKYVIYFVCVSYALLVLHKRCFIERGDRMAKLKTKELVVSKYGEATIIASNELRFDSNSANGRVSSKQ